MEVVSIIITLVALIATVIFGYLQIVVPFIKKEVRLSRKFPYIESTDIPTKRRRKRKKKRSRWLIPITAVAVIMVVIILLRVLLLQAAELPPKPIAVMTFENLTGDESYDYLCKAIPNLLITNLEQSGHLQVMTWERMHDLLKQLDKEDIEIIDEETGFELCRMDDVNTIITGSFTKMGDMFVTDIKILDVSSKKLLKTANSKGEGVASILKVQVDDLSRDIAKNVSLFERTVAPTQMQVMEVTTSSMEAYNYFLRGRNDYEKWYFDDARKFLEKAIDIDSTFASAYLYLAFAYGGLNNRKERNAALEKANSLSHKATEKERLWIESWYAKDIEGDMQTRFRILKLMPRKYPKDKMAHLYLGKYYNYVVGKYNKAIKEYNTALGLDPDYGWAILDLAYLYADLGDYNKALEYLQRYAAVSPGDANPFDCMGDIYFQMGKLDQALEKYKEAIEIKPDFWDTSRKIAYLYELDEDYAESVKWLDHEITMASSSGRKASGCRARAYFHSHLGNFRQALTDLDTIKYLLSLDKGELDKMSSDYVKGWVYYNLGKYELSKNYFEKCHFYLKSDSALHVVDHNFPLALIDLKQQNCDSAIVKLAVMKTSLPDIQGEVDREIAQLYYDCLYAEALLANDSLERVIEVYETALRFRVNNPNNTSVNYLIHFFKDVVARVYLKKGEVEKAILEFERLVDIDPNKRECCLIRPTWRYELAKLYEEKGDKTKAIEQYEKFLDIWKDADADLPEPHDARKRLARMKAGSRD